MQKHRQAGYISKNNKNPNLNDGAVYKSTINSRMDNQLVETLQAYERHEVHLPETYST